MWRNGSRDVCAPGGLRGWAPRAADRPCRQTSVPGAGAARIPARASPAGEAEQSQEAPSAGSLTGEGGGGEGVRIGGAQEVEEVIVGLPLCADEECVFAFREALSLRFSGGWPRPERRRLIRC